MAPLTGALTRPLPEFPREFYTGVDVSINNRGYGYTIYEAYDSTCQAVVQEIYMPDRGHVRYLYDYQNQRFWIIRSATKSAQASCSAKPLDRNNAFVHEDGRKLASAAHFLSFHKKSRYVTRKQAGYPEVRCASTAAIIEKTQLTAK